MNSGGEARALQALGDTTFDSYWLDSLDSLDEKGGWRKHWVTMMQKMGFPITL